MQEEVDDEEPVSDDKRLEHDEELDGAGGRATVGKKRQGIDPGTSRYGLSDWSEALATDLAV